MLFFTPILAWSALYKQVARSSSDKRGGGGGGNMVNVILTVPRELWWRFSSSPGIFKECRV